MSTLQALLINLIDYAGLYPPAKLDMLPAVTQYAQCQSDIHSWMLGHFICPTNRFSEFESAISQLHQNNKDNGSSNANNLIANWSVSALVGNQIESGLISIDNLLQRQNLNQNQIPSQIIIENIEAKIDSVHNIDDALDIIHDNITAWFEFPLTDDFRGYITALAGTDHGAKIRTGGITPDLYPSCETLAKFISTCHNANVMFKATAGLHHPLRHYNKNVGTMEHGFLNLFTAACLCKTHNLKETQIQPILEIEDPQQFKFENDSLKIFNYTLTTQQIQSSRNWAKSYGSCSFSEPIDDLISLQLLD